MIDLLHEHDELVDFVNAGVTGFIMRDASLDDVVWTIRVVADGGHVLPPQLTGSLFVQIAGSCVRPRLGHPPGRST